MNNFINSFMVNYFLMFLVIVILLFAITESIKKHLDFNKIKKYEIIKNTIIVIQSILLVVTLVITGVSIYSMTLPSQY